MKPPVDSRFRVEILNATLAPQRTIWCAMHQDYSEEFVFDEIAPEETKAGQSLIKNLLTGSSGTGDKGHYGPLEHAQIVFNVGWFPHSVMQQARTHRVGVSFDCQSFRYTSQRIIDVVTGARDVEDVFYLRPLGFYTNRQGKKYEYTHDMRIIDVARACDAAGHYAHQIRQGMAEEQARGLLPFDTRQHFVVSFSLRALLHFLDLRSKRDAQHEIQALFDLMWPHMQSWAPEIAEWYEKTRLHRARLAP